MKSYTSLPPTFTLLAQSATWYALLAVLLLAGCKKDAPPAPDELAEARAAWTAVEQRFFDPDFAEQHHSSLRTDTDRLPDDPWVQKTLRQAILDNYKTPFVPGLVQSAGYALWQRPKLADDPGEYDQVLFIPVAKLQEGVTSSILAAYFHIGQARPDLFLAPRSDLMLRLHNFTADEKPTLVTYVALMIHFDDTLFGYQDPVLVAWLAEHG